MKNKLDFKLIFIILAVLALTFFLVYSPHINYKFPLHIDEWHHITEGIRLNNGEYQYGYEYVFRIGFHIILGFLDNFFDLVEVYHLFPAIWACVSSLMLFYVVSKKTGNNFAGIMAMVFFASIKSNTNLTGLWFFTPLTFSIPFIFLYMFLFTEGVEKNDIKKIYYSLAIMLLLIFVHPISVFFSIPILIIYLCFNLKFLWENKYHFLAFLLIPIVSFLFYIFVLDISFVKGLSSIFKELIFLKSWAVFEINNSFFELYSLIGFVFAIIGMYYLWKHKKHKAYFIWPIVLFVLIIFYRIAGFSLLSPYQRNMYYFVISLPFLSAIGVAEIFEIIQKYPKKLAKSATLLLIIVILLFSFTSYYNVPNNLKLYNAIDEEDYNDLIYLKELPNGDVMADPLLSSAIYPVSGKLPVASLVFYNDTNVNNKFFSSNCNNKGRILKNNNVRYVFSPEEIDCGWDKIYEGKNIIYEYN